MASLSRFLALALLFSPLSAASKISKRAAGTAIVDLAITSGQPQHLASGIIYGIPFNDDGSVNTAIPDHLYREIGLNYGRAGGAQLASPNLGWVAGQLDGRFTSALSEYRTTRKFDGRFTLLLHDLWGSDSLPGTELFFPGDEGNWTSYDNFLAKVVSLIRENDMTDGLDIDIWNEPDLSSFWRPSRAQFLAMWKRGYDYLKKELRETPLIGPSSAIIPTRDNAIWNDFSAFIAANNCIPDVYAFHTLRYNTNIRMGVEGLAYMRDSYNLPERPITINEYGASSARDQSPAGSVWYIAGLERYNIPGLRANWASGLQLHDNLASLVAQDSAGYFPSGEWETYKYYATNMTGTRVKTIASADDQFDAYAVKGSTPASVKILAAVRPYNGVYNGIVSYDLTIKGLSSLGLRNSVAVRTRRFDNTRSRLNNGGSTDLGVANHAIVNDQITFWVRPQSVDCAYAFEFVG